MFPCITAENIHYDDEMFRAVLVSMGAMGVIYAVILEVVPQYSLLQFNKWSTWEDLKAEQMGDGFAGLFDGSWSGLTAILQQLGIENHSPNRFAQVVINPIRNDDGKHNCHLSNRVELPLRARSGVQPLIDYTKIRKEEIRAAITSDPNFGHSEALNFHFHGPSDEGEVIEIVRNLLTFCKSQNYPWAVRAVIDRVMQKTFPKSST